MSKYIYIYVYIIPLTADFILKFNSPLIKMLEIRPAVFVQSQGSISGYGILSEGNGAMIINSLGSSITPPYFLLTVTPSSDFQNVDSVTAIYNDGEGDMTVVLKSEVRNLQNLLNSDILPEGSIPEKIQSYLSLYGESDVQGMVLQPLSDTSGMILDPMSTTNQMALDSFIVGVGSYIASLKFLLDDRVYSELPFSFTLPFHSVDENVLNANTFRYMCQPAAAIATHSQYCKGRILLSQILRFCNEWSPLFDDGPAQDMNVSLRDTMAGYCKLSVSEMSTFQKEMLSFRDEMSNMRSVLDSSDVPNDIREEVEEMMHQTRDALEEEIDLLLEKKLKHFRKQIRDIITEEIESTSERIIDLSSKSLNKKRDSRKKRHRSRD